jgi:NhaP-type Na+/H+ or K+/H+ antiporter
MLVMLHDLLLRDVMLEALLFSSSLSHRQEDIHEAFSDILRLLIAGVLSATVV